MAGELITDASRSLRGLLSEAFATTRVVMPVSAAVIVASMGVYQLANGAALEFTGSVERLTFALQEGLAPDELAELLGIVGASAIVGWFVTLVVACGVAHAVFEADRGRALRAVTLLRVGFDASGSALGASVVLLVLGFGVLGLVSLLLTPVVAFGLLSAEGAMAGVVAAIGVGIGAVMLMAVPAAVHERSGPLVTLRRAFSLTRHAAGRVALLVGVLALVFPIALLAGVLVTSPVRLGAPTATWVADAAAATAIAVLLLPPAVAAGVHVYVVAATDLDGGDPRRRSPGDHGDDQR